MDLKGETGNDLSDRIQKAQQGAEKHSSVSEHLPKRNLGADFLGAVGGGGLLGALLDYACGTSPWCLLGFLLLGFVVAIVGAWRAMQSGS